MNVWAVVNQKGGVGKTTTVVTLAGLLSSMGKRVLLVDTDPHGSLTAYFGFNPDELKSSVYNLFQTANSKSSISPEYLLITTAYEDIVVLAATPAMATLDRQLGTRTGMGLVLARALNQLCDKFDFVLIDCAPVLGVLMINALAASQKLIIPVQTEPLALKGLERMLRTLSMVTRVRKDPLDYLIVPTLYDAKVWAAVESMNTLRKNYLENLWEPPVPVDTQFQEASRAQVPLSLVNRDAPGVKAYQALLDNLLNLKPKNTLNIEPMAGEKVPAPPQQVGHPR